MMQPNQAWTRPTAGMCNVIRGSSSRSSQCIVSVEDIARQLEAEQRADPFKSRETDTPKRVIWEPKQAEN